MLGRIFPLTFYLVKGGVFLNTDFFFNVVYISILAFITSMFCVILTKSFPTLILKQGGKIPQVLFYVLKMVLFSCLCL